jgi:hypothetical protein
MAHGPRTLLPREAPDRADAMNLGGAGHDPQKLTVGAVWALGAVAWKVTIGLAP